MRAVFVGPLAALLLAIGAACGGEKETQPTQPATSGAPPLSLDETSTPSPTIAPAQPSATLAPDSPTVTPVPLANPPASPLSVVLEKLRPSMVRIRIDDWDRASGFVVDGGYVVTAAHVAWSSTVVDVVFENGTEHTNVPVVSYDYLADLAFLGPIDTSAPHVELANVDDESEGSPVFNIGYPEDDSELSAMAGEVAYVWDWTDADVQHVVLTAGGISGMSGGPITNRDGEVLGVLIDGGDSGSIGASSNIVRNRLVEIARGEMASATGLRLLPDDIGTQEHEFVLRGRWDTETFIFRGDGETPVSIDFDSYEDVEYGLFNEFGSSNFRIWHGGTLVIPEFQSTRHSTGTDQIYYPFYPYGTWFVVLRQQFDIEREGVIKSSVPLVRYRDPDDGRELQIGDTVAGVFTPGDVDRYTIRLGKGQRVGIRFQSNSWIRVTIDYPDAPPYETASLEGSFQEIEYEAPVDTKYTIVVQSSGWQGGYTLSVSESQNLTPAVHLDRPDDVIKGPVGDMRRHKFEHSVPTVQVDYPANITGGDHSVVLGSVLFEQGRRGETVTLEDADLSYLGQSAEEEITFGEYLERSVLLKNLALRGEVVTDRREVETPSGSPILIEEFDADGDFRGVRLVYIHEGKTGFMAVYYAPSEVFEEWRPVVNYSIGTFSIGAFSVAERTQSH